MCRMRMPPMIRRSAPVPSPFIRLPISSMVSEAAALPMPGEISGTWRHRSSPQPVQERMMTLSPRISLSFNGQCETAFKFYERCFGGKFAFMLRWGDSPMAKEAPPEWGQKILHGRITVGDTDLIGADALPQQYEQPKGFSVLLNMADPEDLLGAPLRRARRSIRRALGDQLRRSAMTAGTKTETSRGLRELPGC